MIRFGPGERALPSADVEFVGIHLEERPAHEKYISGKKDPPMSWLVNIRAYGGRGARVRLLGPYSSLAEAWTSYREMDESDRALLRMEES